MNLLLAGTIGASLDSIFYNFDMAIFNVFGGIQNDILTLLAKLLSATATPLFGVLMGLLGIGLCFFKRTRRIGFAMVFALALGTLITNFMIKPMVLRVRPYNTLQHNPLFWQWYQAAGSLCESDYCFPSGHTVGATELNVVLMLCHLKGEGKHGKKVAWIFPLIAIGVAASRIYLMLHYPSDVFAGLIIGTIMAIVGYLLSGAAVKFLRKHRLNRKLDFTRKFKHGISTVVAVVAIGLVTLISYAVSCVLLLQEGGPNTPRCAYDREYNCQNEAQVDSKKYPPIDGEEYCKIHWKQLSDEFAETGTFADGSEPTREEPTKKEIETETPTVIEPQTVEPPTEPPTQAPAINDVFIHYGFTGFRDNYYNDRPEYMVFYKAGVGEEYVYDTNVMDKVFEILKGVAVGAEDTSGEIILDQELEIAFIMGDGTEYKVAFDAPHRLVDGDLLFTLDNNNGIYDFNIYDYI